MDDDLERDLDDFAGTVLAQRPAVSMAVAVTDRERTLAVRSYGPVDVTTMFQIGSIGKSFTAIVALQLVEQGLLTVATVAP